MHKEKASSLDLSHKEQHQQNLRSPLSEIEINIINNIFDTFGSNVQIFFQRRPSWNRPQTDTESAFRAFLAERFKSNIEIEREPIEYIRAELENGAIKTKAAIPDWGIKVNGGPKKILEITLTPESTVKKWRRKSKLKSIIAKGFSSKTEDVQILNMKKNGKNKKIRDNEKFFDFRVLDSEEKITLVKVYLDTNQATSKLRILPLDGAITKVTLFCQEHLRRIEEKNGVKIIHEDSIKSAAC